ncbi:single-stranded DNA-binding protein, mitochondrial-like isoform X2 [Apostichopus japonicus]|uniref:single-stranded DNA-binding protein, mitochondrial-like isoform X2 n=1 Tax=Stichopus japonicus TaxID=307972 RepID=UPI003AB31C52
MIVRRCIHFSARRLVDNETREKCLNKVTLLGRVGNINLRGKESDHPVLQLSLATHNYYKPKGSETFVQTTEWHRVKIFRPGLRDNVYVYASTGSRLLVEGQLRYSQYEDEEEIERREMYIQADNVIFLTSGTKD